jgi:hypothetical protein
MSDYSLGSYLKNNNLKVSSSSKEKEMNLSRIERRSNQTIIVQKNKP